MSQKDLPPPKTWSQINILIFGFPKTPKTAFYVLYFCRYKLSNVEGQKWNFSSQKSSKFQILSYKSVMYLKRKLRTCRIQIQVEKVWFFGKKPKFLDFWIFFPKGGPFGVETVNFFFSIFQNFITLFSKIASLGPNRYWNKQSHEFWWL